MQKSAELWGVIPGWFSGVGTGPGHAGNPKHMLPRDAPLGPLRFAVPVSGQCPARDEGDAGTEELSNKMAFHACIPRVL